MEITNTSLTSSGIALRNELLQERNEIQQLFIGRIVEPAFDRDAVVNLHHGARGSGNNIRKCVVSAAAPLLERQLEMLSYKACDLSRSKLNSSARLN